MAKKIYGSIQLQNQSQLKLANSDNTFVASIQAPAGLAADYTLTLPGNDGDANQFLQTNGSGVLTWASALSAALAQDSVFVGNGSGIATATDTAAQGDIAATSGGGLNIKAGVIVNADINASAAIAYSKLAALTTNRALASDGSGFVSATAVTDTELGYVSGVTSAIQTQLNAKASTALSNLASVAINTSLVSDTDNTDDLGSSSVTWRRAYLKTGLVIQESGAGTDAVTIQAPAALAGSYTLTLPVDDGASGEVLATNGSGVLSWVSLTDDFAQDWLAADGATLVVTHNLGTKDVIVSIYDTDDDSTIDVDSVVRTDTDTVTLTASQAPATAWRVLIHAVQ